MTRKLFHGTSSVTLDSIKKSGLCPPRLHEGFKGAEFEPEHADTVYASESEIQAWAIADQTAYVAGGKPIVLAFDAEKLTEKGCKLTYRPFEVTIRSCGCIPPKDVTVIEKRPRDI